MSRGHAAFGGSNASIWLNCPGMVALAATAPPEQPSPYAELGTRAHSLLEYCLSHTIDDARTVVASPGDHRVEGGPFDYDMADAVNVALDYVYALLDEDGASRLLVEANVEPVEHLADVAYGTADVVIWQPTLKRLVVIDYKHGAGLPVDVEENNQLLFYALGARRLFSGIEIKDVLLGIIQPRIAGAPPVKTWVTSPARLDRFQDEMRSAIRKARTPESPRIAGDHCRWCKAAGICPELRDSVSTSLAEAAPPMDLKAALADVHAEFRPPDPDSLAPEALGKILRVAPQLEGWIAAVESAAVRHLTQGTPVPGYKLVAKDSRRKWRTTDECGIADWLMLVADLDEETTRPRRLATITEIEKALKRTLPKNEFDEVKANMTLRWTIKDSAGLKLAPESDRRPAVNPTDFATLVQGVDLDGETL